MAAFSPVDPQWTPRDFADTRAAWEGPLSDDGDLRVRVEASGYRGRLVSFAVVGPWTQPTLMTPRSQTRVDRMIGTGITLVILATLIAAGLLARRNVRANRADRRGAARLATVAAAIGLAAWVLRAHHQSEVPVEYASLLQYAGIVALNTTLLWAIYLALEPYVRRFWPDGLLGWSRLLTGHIRDPRVGRDVLTGAAAGALIGLINVAKAGVIPWLGYDAPSPTFGVGVDMLAGPGMMSGFWMLAVFGALQAALVLVMMIVLLRLVLRRRWLIIPVTVLCLSIPFMAQLGTTNTSLIFVFPLAAGALLAWVIHQSGLLAFTVAWFFWIMLANAPMRQDMSHWSAGAGNWTLAALAAVVCFGFYASRGGQPLLGTVLKD
jgi:serine/threonine-protein kinase